ncbi:unnamed protein product, partial [Mesorhabditis spiculigera]
MALQFVMRRFLSLHVLLVLSCVIYILLGAFIFQQLEGKHQMDTKREQLSNIEKSSQLYLDKLWKLSRKYRNKFRQTDELVNFVKEQAQGSFHEYVDTVFTAHRVSRHGYDEDAPTWDFLNSVFFVTTMLTSIGYGYVVPSTFGGRLFGVCYCLIGIPLTLVTVANVAKFISETVFLLHYEVIMRSENWSYVESCYFMFISILTVGFGDFRPSSGNLVPVLFLVLGGVILTTMCMDVFGRMYLKEIHYLGRKLKSSNPFYLIREAKARRRRAAMASLLAQLAKGMIFAHKDYTELSRGSRKRRKRDQKRKGSHVLPHEKFMFARLPPDPPTDCQVVSTSAYSVRIAWAPAFSTDEDVTYNIRYRLKHNAEGRVLELRGVKGHTAEIMSVDSCSLYEFRITAVSKYGESKPVYLVQYTEPQLSPQHILAKRVNANTVELTWEPPYKRTYDVKNYIVYFTENPSANLSEWDKIPVNGRRVVFPDLRYDWFYMFSAAAIFKDGQRSPLSRALFIKTDKLEFHPACVGQSRTVEVMESLLDREETDTTPLLKRDYSLYAEDHEFSAAVCGLEPHGKGCLYAPPGCAPNKDCQIHFSYRVENTDLIMEIGGGIGTHEYMAVGFTKSGEMFHSSVTACLGDGLPYIGHIAGERRIEPISWPSGQSMDSFLKTDTYIQCIIRRRLSNTNNELIFDLNSTKFSVIMARGKHQDGGLRKHTGRWKVTRQPIDLALYDGVETNETRPEKPDPVRLGLGVLRLKKAHGALMIVAWTVCLSSGILIARHFKEHWPEQLFLNVKPWFNAHRGFNSLGLLLILTSLVMILCAKGGVTIRFEYPGGYHGLFGISACILAWLQPINALFRCDPTAENRWIFNMIHRTSGYLAWTLAIITIMIALQEFGMTQPPLAYHLYLGYLGLAVFCELCLELTSALANPVQVKPQDTSNREQSDRDGVVSNKSGSIRSSAPSTSERKPAGQSESEQQSPEGLGALKTVQVAVMGLYIVGSAILATSICVVIITFTP